MFRWLRNWFWRRCRETDLAILWPECKRLAPTLDEAKAAFAVHAFNDPAWANSYGVSALIDIIDKLE